MNGAILHVDMTTGTHRMIDDPELFGEFLLKCSSRIRILYYGFCPFLKHLFDCYKFFCIQL